MLWLLLLLIIPAIYVIQAIHLAIVVQWSDARTVGLNYYGLPAAGRDRFKRRLRLQAKLLAPILWVNRHTATLDFRKARIVYKGISAPSGTHLRHLRHLRLTGFQILHRGNGSARSAPRPNTSMSRGIPSPASPVASTSSSPTSALWRPGWRSLRIGSPARS